MLQICVDGAGDRMNLAIHLIRSRSLLEALAQTKCGLRFRLASQE
jgi:hypothetical protein